MDPAVLSSAFPSTSSYVGVVVLLMANSFGLPLPEEVILVLAGAAAYEGRIELLWLIVAAMAAIATADFFVYLIGRRWGPSVLRWKLLRFLVRPDRVNAFAKRYENHVIRGVFTVRFISGLRAPAYFAAGTLNVKAPKFLAADAAAILIHVPVYTAIGFVFGAQVGNIIVWLHRIDRSIAAIIILGVIAGAVYVGYRFGLRKGN
jgi:membrane protein DedA with SNARE-associated domain